MNKFEMKNVIENTGNEVKKAVSKGKDIVFDSKDKVFDALDINKDGRVDTEDIIILGLRIPGVHIDREEFLRKQFMKNYSNDVIQDAVKFNPAHAGIKVEEIDNIADQVIQYERNCVSGISLALGAPGGAAIFATLPTDIAQYYGYMLRTIQKLLYLYGFPEINVGNGVNIDDETMNLITLCLGVMYGVEGSVASIKVLSNALGKGVEKKLLQKALTKGTFYPIVKKISRWFGVYMTKQVFAGFFKKAIPVVGGVVGGGITYLSFKPCCDNLKKSLQDTALCNPSSRKSFDEFDVIDA
ncbi:MAG: EcsC family protein [Catenibacterium mitsuokai]|nr:EcsC family protein [Catenibacterium mitsuokai]MDD6595469.1 EcsC family protein [Catenibacterium mitsuokai]